MLDLPRGFAIVGAWLILVGIITIVRRKRLSAAWIRRMRFWLGRDEEPALAEFDRGILGWALVGFGLMLLFFDLLG